MAISRSEDEDRIRIAEILGWINIDWHFDRTIPMHTWLGGTPLGMQTGYIEEIPEYASDGVRYPSWGSAIISRVTISLILQNQYPQSL